MDVLAQPIPCLSAFLCMLWKQSASYFVQVKLLAYGLVMIRWPNITLLLIMLLRNGKVVCLHLSLPVLAYFRCPFAGSMQIFTTVYGILNMG